MFPDLKLTQNSVINMNIFSFKTGNLIVNWIKSSNNNVIFKKFKNKIYFGYYINLQLCYKQHKIRFYLQILQKILKTLKCRHIQMY